MARIDSYQNRDGNEASGRAPAYGMAAQKQTDERLLNPSKTVKSVPPLLCPNARIAGSTAYVRPTNQSIGLGNMLYSIGFTATDETSGAICMGTVPVCVQNLFQVGQPCTGTATYNATACGG